MTAFKQGSRGHRDPLSQAKRSPSTNGFEEPAKDLLADEVIAFTRHPDEPSVDKAIGSPRVLSSRLSGHSFVSRPATKATENRFLALEVCLDEPGRRDLLLHRLQWRNGSRGRGQQ